MHPTKLLKASVLTTGLVTLSTAFAASDITVHAPNGVGNVTELVEALTTVNAGTTSRKVLLEPGVYDLKDVEMKTGSHLSLTKTGCWLIGTGDGPEDVVLKGGGEAVGRRVLNLSGGNYGNYCNVSNVTITGGWTSGDGGGISGHAHARAFCCILTNNYATGTNGGGGGGMFKGIARNCLFVDNVVSRGVAGAHHGGGMWTNGDISLGVCQGAYDCVFSNNWSRANGGGFHGQGEVKNCKFFDNFAQGVGGGVNSARWLSGCTFSGNRVGDGYGGGAYMTSGGVTNCIFSKNFVQYEGGGGLLTRGDIPVVGCSFQANSCNRAGGGILCFGGLVTNCTFVCNSNRTDNVGGGLAMLQNYPDKTAQDYTELNKTFTCVDCTFEGNLAASNGGGIAAPGGVFNCTFVTNVATKSGGGLYADRASNCGPVSNCVFRLNKSGVEKGGNALAGAGAAIGLTAIGCELSANTNGGCAACAYVTFRDSVITNHWSSEWIFLNCNFLGCLIADNHSTCSSNGTNIDYGDGSYTNANTVFLRNYQAGNNKITGGKIVINCNYVSNEVSNANWGNIVDPSAYVYNTVFVGNKLGDERCDFRKKLKDAATCVPTLYNCTYSKLASDVPAETIASRWTDCFKATKAELKLSAKPGAEFVPRASSPLVNAALEEPWIRTALGDKDFYGNPRVKGGKLDIGAAECAARGSVIQVY